MIVKYMINETGVIVTKEFDSQYEAIKLVNRLRYSKRCTLISYIYKTI